MSSTTADLDLLSRIGAQYGSEKVSSGFCTFYDLHLRAHRKRVVKVLEIGIPGGSSLYMWRDYFPRAAIHGMDLHPVKLDALDRITTHIGNREDREALRQIVDSAGSDFDLIVDNGGRTIAQQQISLGFLFSCLRPGGYYVVENLHISFSQRFDIDKSGRARTHYETDVGDCESTTYEIVQALSEGSTFGSEFMMEVERQFLAERVQWVEIFDRNGERQHMTCMLKKRPLSLMRRVSLGITNRRRGNA